MILIRWVLAPLLFSYLVLWWRRVATGAACALVYLIRDHDETTVDHVQADYDQVDNRLIACLEFKGEEYKKDNRKLYQLLKPKVIDGDLWSFIQAFDDRQDGRAAYKALLAQAEGPAAKKERVRQAYALMQSLHFTGKARNFPFDKYVQRHQHCHNVLAEKDNTEQLTETKKIEDFLKGIQDSRLDVAKAVVSSNDDRCDTFSKVQVYLTADRSIVSIVYHSHSHSHSIDIDTASIKPLQPLQALLS